MLSSNNNLDNNQDTYQTIIESFSPQNLDSAPNYENKNNTTTSDKEGLVICTGRAVCARIEKANVKFDDLIGLNKAKSDLRNYLVYPSMILQKSQRAQSYGAKGILLYGPSGCGKTSLIQACAHEMNAKFYIVQGRDFFKDIKRPHKFIKELFTAAKENQPACIVLEDLDYMFSSHGHIEETEIVRRTKVEFLVQMLNAYADPEIFIIGTTEAPWRLQAAVKRRFTLKIPVFPPEQSDRCNLLTQKLLEIVDLSLDPLDISVISQLTEGYSYKNLVDLVRFAVYEPTRELQQAKYFKKTLTEEGEDPIYEACFSDDPEAQELNLIDIPYENIKTRKMTIDDFYKAIKKSSAMEIIVMDQYQAFLDEYNNN